MVAAGTTTALIMLRRKWERHRANKKGVLNGDDDNHFLKRWGFGLFSIPLMFGQFKYPRTPACNQVDTYPGGYNVSDGGKNGGVKINNDRRNKKN